MAENLAAWLCLVSGICQLGVSDVSVAARRTEYFDFARYRYHGWAFIGSGEIG
jgi:hypothetical protein